MNDADWADYRTTPIRQYPDLLRETAEADMREALADHRHPCPTSRHHAHPGLDCQQYEQWRADILAAITPKDQR